MTSDYEDEILAAARKNRLAEIEKTGTRHFAPAGETFIHEGDYEQSLIIITSGEVRTYSGTQERMLTYSLYGPGESFGELTLDGGPRNTSIEAITDTEYTLVQKDLVLAFIATHPEFTFDLLGRATQRARVVTATARGLALQDNYQRLSSCLNQLAGDESSEGQGSPGLKITHQELASRVGCSREMVSLLLKDLRVGGFIESSRSTIRILKKLPKDW